ncbi:hypothetical protein Desaci_4769 (plasmid) [Desulfosporosinus acidiphilus SJ4]|uniref:Uncharacterized protein n=1 Tax=Desulfosporosinus acidiphilus (strain DSM 22704 / JCM 16185 / SJ4) TaxID=646529 RepID=I4DCS1_DESAJ|nr:hypothetical protein Desaci_4769 [Desulfosporosinus acidiphilus SJ4]
MNTKTKCEIKKRLEEMGEPTDEQIKILSERIKRHKETYGTLNYQGCFQRLTNLFRKPLSLKK